MSTLPIYRSYGEFRNPGGKKLTDCISEQIDKIEHLLLPYKIAQCGLKWTQAFTASPERLSQVSKGLNFAERALEPLTLLKALKASCKLFKSASQLQQTLSSSDSDRKKLMQSARAVAIDLLKWVEKESKLLLLLNKRQIVVLTKLYPGAPKLLFHLIFITSSFASCFDFNKSLGEFSGGGEASKWEKRNLKIELSHKSISLISTALLGASLYFSIFLPSMLSLGLSTIALVMDIVKEIPKPN